MDGFERNWLARGVMAKATATIANAAARMSVRGAIPGAAERGEGAGLEEEAGESAALVMRFLCSSPRWFCQETCVKSSKRLGELLMRSVL